MLEVSSHDFRSHGAISANDRPLLKVFKLSDQSPIPRSDTMTLPDTPRTYNALTKTFICLYILTAVTSLVSAMLFAFVIYPGVTEAHIRYMARATPALSTPRLNFLSIPYDSQSHSVPSFIVSHLDDCLGLFSSFE